MQGAVLPIMAILCVPRDAVAAISRIGSMHLGIKNLLELQPL